MLYTVAEVSEQLGVSKQTIYTKLNTFKKDLKPYIRIQNNTRYIESEGIEIIKNSIQANQFNSSNLKYDESEDELEELRVLKNEYFQDLKQQIEYLKVELEKRDRQLESKDKQIISLNDLVRNSQVLLKQEQEKKLLMQEQLKEEILKKQQEQIQAENQKLFDYIAVTREEENRKGFWNRLFNKK